MPYKDITVDGYEYKIFYLDNSYTSVIDKIVCLDMITVSYRPKVNELEHESLKIFNDNLNAIYDEIQKVMDANSELYNKVMVVKNFETMIFSISHNELNLPKTVKIVKTLEIHSI